MSNGLIRPPRQQVMGANFRLRDGLNELTKALLKFGNHTSECPEAERTLEGCPCGWAMLRNLLRARGGQAPEAP